MPLAVVTGANTGIGFHTAGQLAAKGYDVVCACRDAKRGKEAVISLRDWYGSGLPAEFRELNLASFASVQAFAAGLAARHSRLDLLVCNAGVNSASVPQEPEAQLTEDGVDLLYQTNFLSHLLLVLLLMPLLRAALGRVVNVTSVVHRSADPAHFGLTRSVREPYVSLYGLSKLAQIAATGELHRRFHRHRVSFHCVNPGGVASNIWRDYPAWKQLLGRAVLADSETAARTVTAAAETWEGRSLSGQPFYWNGYKGADMLSIFEYWSPRAARGSLVASEPSRDALDPELGLKVWEESIEVIRSAGIEIDVGEGDVAAA